MNEILRRAILSVGLDEVDLAARLEVDPKTVRRWLEGRLPYARHRWALASLLHLDETDLWPELRATGSRHARPEEFRGIYPHRSVISRQTWRKLFQSAEREINILDDNCLLLTRNADIIDILIRKAQAGVCIRIILTEPEESHAKDQTKIQKAIVRFRPLQPISQAEIRLYRGRLYNTLYRADSELLISQRAYGISVSEEPILHLYRSSSHGVASMYLDSFESLWKIARPT